MFSLLLSIISTKVIIRYQRKIKITIEKEKESFPVYQRVISRIILFLATLIAGGLAYYRNYFSQNSLEDVFFALTTNIGGTSSKVIKDISIYMFIFFVIFYAIATIIIYSNKYKLYLHIKKKKISLIPFEYLAKNKISGSLIILFLVLLVAYSSLGVKGYIQAIRNPGELYEKFYVDPMKAKLTFPEKKKNLVHIVLESMETTLFSVENGGGFQKSIIPELERLALENTSFTNDEKIASGLFEATGCSWTASALVCQSSGVGLRSFFSSSDELNSFLPGAYPLGKILGKEDYNLKVIMGSDASFHNRDKYYQDHGPYDILDYYRSIELGYISQDYKNWWGYEDSKLYEISKSELSKLASEDKPFAVTLLTADTHFPDGYLDQSCPFLHDNQYLSSYSCASTMLNNFLNWLKQQDFYKDTVVVITGDHLTMQDKFFDFFPYENRYIYNTFINSSIKAPTKIRKATSFDIFPTIIASLGVEIENNRLGLGTNLYSEAPTVLETLGKEEFQKETRAMSNYYNQKIARPKNGGRK